MVLPPSAWERKGSRTKGCFLLVFTDKLPRLLRAACQPDRVVSAIPPPEGVQAGFRHLNVEPGAVGLDADHAPQFANGLFRSFAVQGGDDFARKCYMTAHSRDVDRIESNLPAKNAPRATF